MVLIISLLFRRRIHPVTYVREVREHMYGHNLEPHRLGLVHVIRDVMSSTLNKVVINRILRVIHCINVHPGGAPP